MIIDTNALSAGADEDPAVMPIMASAPQLALPVVVIGEYRFGIADSRHGAQYKRWLESVITDSRVLDVTEETTRHYAAIKSELRRAGKPIPVNDLWIAALCRQHQLPLLSRDRHFDSVAGLERIAW